MPNFRKDIPANWRWRPKADGSGRPRWEPSPALRRAGWKGLDLKDAHGQWLTHGASIDRAAAVNAAVAAWRAGEAIPADLQPIAPANPGAGPGGLSSAPLDGLCIGPLLDAYLASKELTSKKPRTQDDRRKNLIRLVDALAGFARLPDRADKPGQARRAAAVAAVRALSILTLAPLERNGEIRRPLHAAYWELAEHAGQHQAAAALAAASAWLNWCATNKSSKIANWTAGVERTTPRGRIKPIPIPVLAAYVQAADEMGLPYVGDALILAVDLDWSQADILALTWPRVQKADGRWRALTGPGGRQKTGRVGAPPFLSMGIRRLAAIRRRNRAAGLSPLKVIHIPREKQTRRTRPDSEPSYFRKKFALVRAHAAKTLPEAADYTFADTRDAGFTLGREAGFGDDHTASRSLQSRKHIAALGDAAYGEIGRPIADQAADMLDPYVEGLIRKHGVKL